VLLRLVMLESLIEIFSMRKTGGSLVE